MLTPDEVVAELRDGMTIGIGGWGSRRKPMALVRAILRSALRDLTIVSYAGPDVGLLAASGQARRVVTGFASLDSIALEPHFRNARQNGTIELTELDEGMVHWGLLAAAHALAAEIAAKDPVVIRLAKQSLNGIDPVDVHRSYRYEQGFTYELTLLGAGDRARQAFVDGHGGGRAGKTERAENTP